MTTNDKLAVLIDADNAQGTVCENLLAEVARYGTATVRRAYGDWTTPQLSGWKEVLHAFAIQPMQQFRYTAGKNATDSAMIIDAMDLLYSGNLDGFCLVSSDSDFTRLATRIRQSGLIVYGFGEKKTPEPFVKACDRFVYTEILRSETATIAAKPAGVSKKVAATIAAAVKAMDGDDGWANLGAVGSTLIKNDPAFDPRNYGYPKLSGLMRAMADCFEVKECRLKNGYTQILVRPKDRGTSR